MLNFRIPVLSMALLFASALGAQEDKTSTGPGFDAQACAKHCQGMAAAHQKMMDAQKAMTEKRQAAWKDIQAQLEMAKEARGEKKVAALETALQKLVAFHESTQHEMGGSPMMGEGMMMDGMNCCGEAGMRMGMDCSMMKK